MTNENCCDCEKEAIQDLVDLQLEYDNLLRWNKMLQKCLDGKEELCDFYRNEYETLKTSNKLWKEKAEKLEKELAFKTLSKAIKGEK